LQSAGQVNIVSEGTPFFSQILSPQLEAEHELFGGALALQLPEQRIVPGFVMPQTFAAELQAKPKFTGTTGANTLHAPLQLIVPLFVPHADDC